MLDDAINYINMTIHRLQYVHFGIGGSGNSSSSSSSKVYFQQNATIKQ